MKDSTKINRPPEAMARRNFLKGAALTLVTAIGAEALGRPPVKFGRIRIDDDSLQFAGINKGDVVLIELGATPKNGDLCAAFLPTGHLRIRRYYRESNGDIRLMKSPDDKLVQVFAPGAVMVFGPVVGVEKGGA